MSQRLQIKACGMTTAEEEPGRWVRRAEGKEDKGRGYWTVNNRSLARFNSISTQRCKDAVMAL